MTLLWLSQVLGILPITKDKSFVKGMLEKLFLQKVSGRIVQFDKIRSLSSCQSGVAPKVILVIAIMNDTGVFTCDVKL